MPLNSAGTPMNSVTRRFATVSSSAVKSRGLGTSTIVPAIQTGKFMHAVMPKTWKNGSAPSTCSSREVGDVQPRRHALRVPRQVAVGQDRALGDARGAARVLQHRDVVEPHRDRGR